MSFQRKISRREMLRGMFAFAGATVLAACTPSGIEPGKPEEEKVTSAPPAAEPINLKLALWGSAEYVKAWEGMIDVYEEQSNQTTVEVIALPSGTEFYQKIQLMLAGNSPLDVFIVEDKMTRFFASNGVIIPMNEFVTTDDLSKYYASTVDPFKWEGKIYGLPRRVNNTAVYYNKTMFEQEGIDFPAEGWTQDDFLDAAQALTKKSGDETEVYGADFLLVYQHIAPWVWSNGGEFFTEDFSESLVTMPEVVDTLQFVADLRYKYGVMAKPEVSDAMEGVNGMFMSKKLATTGGGYGCWLVPTYRQIEDFEWDIAPLPKGRVSKTNIVYASCFAVSTRSEHPAEAIDFTLFSTGPVAQAEESKNPTAIPSLIEIAESAAFIDPEKKPENMRQFLKELEVGRPAADIYPPTTYAECAQAFTEELDPLWLGNKSAAECCNTLKERLDQILADA
ncbi:MAG: sugar ABC transporter substrate-binding protein [Anaerolineae bacterium]|nr:sugar ABC transporter substrate-binding protein [Anaerolineae bacterium]